MLSRVPVYLLDGSSPDADGVGVRPGFEALFADFAFADSVGRFTRSFLASGSESHATSHPVKSVDDEALELALMFTLAGSSSNDVTAAHLIHAHLASIVERTAHPDESASRRAKSLLASTYRVASSLGRDGRNGRQSCDWLQRALRRATVDAVIPNAMVALVSACGAGSIPDAAASACLEAVARWRGVEGRTRGERISPPAWNLVATDLSNLCVSLSREPGEGDGDRVDVTRVITARLSSLAGVARGLAAVAADAKSSEEIAAAVSGSIVNLEKVLRKLLTVTPKVTDPPLADSASTMDARAAGWTAAAALLSVRLVGRDAVVGPPAAAGRGGAPVRQHQGERGRPDDEGLGSAELLALPRFAGDDAEVRVPRDLLRREDVPALGEALNSSS